MAAAGKTIVISDIHMSNKADYSWFPPQSEKNLADMLNHIAGDQNVEELVLLGDVFDLWLYPVDVIPWTPGQIIGAHPLMTEAMKQCVEKIPTVYYINGNHDMGVKPDDLQPFNAGGRSIQCISPDEYSAKHLNRRRLEHGHAADMFNAPDDSSDTIGGYPLGFFITRLTATARNQSLVREALMAILQEHGEKFKVVSIDRMDLHPGHVLVESIVECMKINAGVHDDTVIRFQEKELDNKFTVGDIKSHYGSLWGAWVRKHPIHWPASMVVALNPEGLDWYAKKLLDAKTPPSVVVMGHTHHSMSRGEYDNDGCWCCTKSLSSGGTKSSYVEITEGGVQLVNWPS